MIHTNIVLCDGFIERTVMFYGGLSLPALLPVAGVKAMLCQWLVHRRQVNLWNHRLFQIREKYVRREEMSRAVLKRKKMLVWVLPAANIVKNDSNLMKHEVLKALISWGRTLFIPIWIPFTRITGFLKTELKLWFLLGHQCPLELIINLKELLRYIYWA